MLGAIAGDIIGSVYEAAPIKTTDFPLFVEASTFTDDTVLTVAAASALLSDGDYARALKRFARAYPHAGYGRSFYQWMLSDASEPYHSWGNGAAMRVSPVAFAFDTPEAVVDEAAHCAAVTHDHPEGIKGAQATALAIFLVRRGCNRKTIRSAITERFGYDLDRRLDDIRPGYRFDVSCAGSVPEAMIAFLEASDFEQAVRNAVSLGGDSDTQACIAGALAQARFGGVPETIAEAVYARLPAELIEVIAAFHSRFRLSRSGEPLGD